MFENYEWKKFNNVLLESKEAHNNTDRVMDLFG